MALFRCNRSGNTVQFRYDFDIVVMRRNPDYTEVVIFALLKGPKVEGTRPTLTLKKPMGKPRKEQL